MAIDGIESCWLTNQYITGSVACQWGIDLEMMNRCLAIVQGDGDR
jgi:hypothetical protein